MHERIKKIRNNLGLTQREFADKIKVKRNTVATYEMGRSVPSDSAISLICREFNVNEDWLRNGTGEMFINLSRDEQIACFVGSIQTSPEDSFKKRFISMLSALEEPEWEALEKMVLLLQAEKD